MTNDDEVLGRNLARLRQATTEFSQRDLAEAMNDAGFPKWSQTTVATVELGKRPLRFTEGLALARIFNVPFQSMTAEGSDAEETIRMTNLTRHWHLQLLTAGEEFVKAQAQLRVLLQEVGDRLPTALLERAEDAAKLGMDDHVEGLSYALEEMTVKLAAIYRKYREPENG